MNSVVLLARIMHMASYCRKMPSVIYYCRAVNHADHPTPFSVHDNSLLYRLLYRIG